MIIQLANNISQNEYESIEKELTSNGFSSKIVRTQLSSYLIAIGKREMDIREIGHLPGVSDVHIVTDLHKLVSRKWKTESTQIRLKNETIGNGNFSLMAGPCSIESEEQIAATAKFLTRNGIKIMRGGVFKPRSSPYSFRGLGIDGLKIFSEICKEDNLNIITEVMEVDQIEKMYPYVDIFQVGARNTQNFNLLDALGKIDKPVMIKRGISGTIDELLYSAEYVFSGGNEQILLCERGIRTYERSYRNTFDINAIPILKEKTHLPVIADPSHGTGIRNLVEPITLASVIAGVDGVITEIHNQPDRAISDGFQSLNFTEGENYIRKVKATVEFKKNLT